METFTQKINDLAKYAEHKEHIRDIVFDVIFELRKSLEDACNNERTKQELFDLIFSKNNCLSVKGVDDLPKEMLEEVKNLQNEIMNTYGMQD